MIIRIAGWNRWKEENRVVLQCLLPLHGTWTLPKFECCRYKRFVILSRAHAFELCEVEVWFLQRWSRNLEKAFRDRDRKVLWCVPSLAQSVPIQKISADETVRVAVDRYGLPPDPVIFTKQLLRNRQNGNLANTLSLWATPPPKENKKNTSSMPQPANRKTQTGKDQFHVGYQYSCLQKTLGPWTLALDGEVMWSRHWSPSLEKRFWWVMTGGAFIDQLNWVEFPLEIICIWTYILGAAWIDGVDDT